MIVLRNKETNLYYAAAGGWTPDLEKALKFPDAVRAYIFSKIMDLTHVEIVIKGEDGEFIIPISDTQ